MECSLALLDFPGSSIVTCGLYRVLTNNWLQVSLPPGCPRSPQRNNNSNNPFKTPTKAADLPGTEPASAIRLLEDGRLDEAKAVVTGDLRSAAYIEARRQVLSKKQPDAVALEQLVRLKLWDIIRTFSCF